MKFYLISIALLMVPLVFADQSDNYTYLYDSDYVIAEAYGRMRMIYNYQGKYELKFLTRNKTESNWLKVDEEFMTLETFNWKTQNLSFAIDFTPDAGDCRERSSPNLRHLISECTKRTVLRELTEEEKGKLADYKAHQEETGERFDFVYERVGKKRSRSRSVGVIEFHVNFSETRPTPIPRPPGSGWGIPRIASSDSEWFNEVYVNAIDTLKRTRMMMFKDLRTGNWGKKMYPISVIGRSDSSDWSFNCYRGGIADVNISGCSGLTELIAPY